MNAYVIMFTHAGHEHQADVTGVYATLEEAVEHAPNECYHIDLWAGGEWRAAYDYQGHLTV